MGKNDAAEASRRRARMGKSDAAGGDAAAAKAREWLEFLMSKESTVGDTLAGGFFSASSMAGFVVIDSGGGRVFCSGRVPARLIDKEGKWHAGSIVAVVDVVGAAAIMTIGRVIKATIDSSAVFFSAAKLHEEVEIEGRVAGHQAERKMTVAEVEVRKKVSRELVALGRVSIVTAAISPTDDAMVAERRSTL